MPTNRKLRTFQWAREAVNGTDLPATSKIAVVGIDFDDANVYERPQLAKGLMVRNPGNEVVVGRGASWSVEESPLHYEQLQNWASMAIKGAVAPTGAGPYVWSFARTLTADPNLDSFTFERRLSTGASNVDHAWHYAMARKLSFRGRRGSSVKFAAEGFARRRQLEAQTAALSMPTPEIVAFGNAKCYIDATFAGIGATQITNQLYGFSIDWMSGAEPQETAEGRADLDYSIDVIDGDKVGLDVELMLLLDPTTYAAELLAAEAQTLRAVQIKVDNGGAGAAARSIVWDMLLKYASAPVKVDEQDGQDVVSAKLVDTTDGTNQFRLIVTNGVSSLT